MADAAAPLGPRDLLLLTAAKLEAARIPYFVGGSMASMMYGEYRTTRDVDVIISVGPRDVAALVAAFDGDEFYIDEPTVRRAVERLDQFNVIHMRSGLKIDFMVVDVDGYDASRFARRRQFEITHGQPVWFAAPEDVILKKLVYYKEGNSDKHLRDIASMFKVSGDQIDRAYAEHWAMRIGVSDLWRFVLARAEGREAGPTV